MTRPVARPAWWRRRPMRIVGETVAFTLFMCLMVLALAVFGDRP